MRQLKLGLAGDLHGDLMVVSTEQDPLGLDAVRLPPHGWMETGDVSVAVAKRVMDSFVAEAPAEFRDVRELLWRRLSCVPDGWLLCVVRPGVIFGLGLYWLWSPEVRATFDEDSVERLIACGGLDTSSPHAAIEWVSLAGFAHRDDRGRPNWLVPLPCEVASAVATLPVESAMALRRPPTASRTDDGLIDVAMTVVTADGTLQRVRIAVAPTGRIAAAEVNVAARGKFPSYREVASDSLLSYVRQAWSAMFEGATEKDLRQLAWMNKHSKLLTNFINAVATVAAILAVIALSLWQAARASSRLLFLPGFALSRSRGVLYDVWAFYVRKVFAILERHSVARAACVAIWFSLVAFSIYAASWPLALFPMTLLVAAYLHATLLVYLPNEAIRTKIFRGTEEDDESIRLVHDFTWEYVGYVALFLLCVPLLVHKVNVSTGLFYPDIPKDVTGCYRYLLATLFKLVPDPAQSLLPQLSLAPTAVMPSAQRLQSLVIWLVNVTVGTVVISKIMSARELRKDAVTRLRRSIAAAVSLGLRIAPEMRKVVTPETTRWHQVGIFKRVRGLFSTTNVPRDRRGEAALVLGLVDDKKSAPLLLRLWESDAPADVRNLALVGRSLINDEVHLDPAASLLLPPSSYHGDYPIDVWRAVAAMHISDPDPAALADVRLLLGWKQVAPGIRRKLVATILRVPGDFSADEVFAWLAEFTGPEELHGEGVETLALFAVALNSMDRDVVAMRLADMIVNGRAAQWTAAIKVAWAWLLRRRQMRGSDGSILALWMCLFSSFGNREKSRGSFRGLLNRIALWQVNGRLLCIGFLLASVAAARETHTAGRPRESQSDAVG